MFLSEAHVVVLVLYHLSIAVVVVERRKGASSTRIELGAISRSSEKIFCDAGYDIFNESVNNTARLILNES